MLTKYGRNQAENLLSTWSYEGESDAAYVGTPDWLLLGGDVRWLNVQRRSNLTPDYSKIFFMAVEGEVAVKPIPGLTVVGTVGKYNEGDKYEYRRNYLLLDISEHWHFRLGRFNGADGIYTADHTAYISRGQGFETYNAEISYSCEMGELFVTRTHGPSLSVRSTAEDGYKLKEENEGYAVRASTFVLLNSVVGYSYWRDNFGYRHGPYATISYSDMAFLAQYDSGSNHRTFFAEADYEFIRGFHLYYSAQRRSEVLGENSQRLRHDIGTKWYPRPHLEIQAAFSRETTGKLISDQYLVMGHFYL